MDRKQLLETVLRGYGVLGNDHPIAPIVKFSATDLAQRDYDPDKARFHLKKAGLEGQTFKLHTSDAAFSGVISGAGLVRKTGAGILTLTGVNTYTGGTSISNGALKGDVDAIRGNVDLSPGTGESAKLVFDETSGVAEVSLRDRTQPVDQRATRQGRHVPHDAGSTEEQEPGATDGG